MPECAFCPSTAKLTLDNKGGTNKGGTGQAGQTGRSLCLDLTDWGEHPVRPAMAHLAGCEEPAGTL
jgi:hypothetical protein